VQYVIAKALSLEHRNLAVTGDPDQSIYGWRGADIANILNFEKDFHDAKIILLEENYRSTPQILAAADAVIANNTLRKKKTLRTDNPAGSPVRLVRCDDQHDEANTIAREIADEIARGKRKASDYAIFYRINALSRNLEHSLRREMVPFQLVRGLEFYQRKEVKDVLAYLRLAYNPSDNVSLERIINEPARGIGATTLKKLDDAAMYHGVSTLEIAGNIANFSGIASKTKKAVANFVNIIQKISKASAQDYSIESLIEIALTESGYRKQYEAEREQEPSEDDSQRLANIDELLAVAKEFDTFPLETGTSALEMFLEQTALTADTDSLDKSTEKVSLMSLHAAKGLEFPVVYIIAMEENVLPSSRAVNSWDETAIEEERRLFFVGITRAEEELRLSRANRREMYGSTTTSIYSRFLLEIPHDKNFVQYESPREFLGKEEFDYGDGIVLVKDAVKKTASKRKAAKEEFVDSDEEPQVQPDFDEGIDPEYDEDGKLLNPKKKEKKKKRVITAPITTAAKLMRN
jgi:DNA helicase-2/ATP-dependent DNA helicase PcrA